MKMLMRYILGVSSILSCAVLAAGCSEELGPTPSVQDSTMQVTLTFGLSMPELHAYTKGELGDKPNIKDIHVALFGSAGFLEAYALASLDEKATENLNKDSDSENWYGYSVTLPVYEGECSLDFIANGPSSLSFGYEPTVMSELSVSLSDDTSDAYWQRFSLEDGIPYDKDRYESKKEVALPDGWEASVGLDKVTLVRNFARMTVSLDPSVSDFTLDGFLLVNAPLKGSIVPYIASSSSFVEKYQDYTYGGIYPDVYSGFMPAGAGCRSFTDIKSNNQDIEDAFVARGSYSYLYESTSSNTSSPVHLIISGEYEGQKTYYKVNLVDADGNPLTILRNFSYEVVIGGMGLEGETSTKIGRKGEDTPEAAENTSGSNAIIGSLNITDASAGYGELIVEYRSKTFATTETDAVLSGTLDFCYIINGVVDNSSVVVEAIEPDSGEYSLFDDDDFDRLETGGKETGWGQITYYIHRKGNTMQSQRFRVKAGSSNNLVEMVVTVWIMGTQTMYVLMNPDNVLGEKGTATTASIYLPSGLPTSIFPLDIAIESDKNSLTPQPGVSLPVETGASLVDGATNTYQFIKSIQYSEYSAADKVSLSATRVTLVDGAETEQTLGASNMVRFDCEFNTTKDDSECFVYVANEYFDSDNVKLSNYAQGSFSGLKFLDESGDEVSKVSQDRGAAVGFSFTTAECKGITVPSYITVVLAGLAPADGYDGLEYVKTDGTKMYYKYSGGATAGSHKLSLKTTAIGNGDGNKQVEVQLLDENERYVPNSASAYRSNVLEWVWADFANFEALEYMDDEAESSATISYNTWYSYATLSGNQYAGPYVAFTNQMQYTSGEKVGRFAFERKYIDYYRLKMGKQVIRYNFEYGYDSEGNLLASPVTISVSGGEVLAEDSRNTGAISYDSSDGTYTFTPSSSTSAQQTFYIESSFLDPVCVSISADGYSEASSEMDRAFYVKYHCLEVSDDSDLFPIGGTGSKYQYSMQAFFVVSDYVATGDATRNIAFTDKKKTTNDNNNGDGYNSRYVSNWNNPSVYGGKYNLEEAMDLGDMSGLSAGSCVYLQVYDGATYGSGGFYDCKVKLGDIYDAGNADGERLSLVIKKVNS